MRAFFKNQTRFSHLSEVSPLDEMEMRRGARPHRWIVLMNKMKSIVYFRNEERKKAKNKGENEEARAHPISKFLIK